MDGGGTVALRLRIGHKLFAGLVLVGVPMLIMLGATLHALSAHRNTVNSIDSRQQEKRDATELLDLITIWLNSEGRKHSVTAFQQEIIANRILEQVDKYELSLRLTLLNNADKSRGIEETDYVQRIRSKTTDFRNSIQSTGLDLNEAQETPPWRTHIEQLNRLAGELCNVIDTDVRNLIAAANKSYLQTRQFVLAVCVGGFVLLLILARLTYHWIATPIRELHAKVTQMAVGQFNSRVQVSSNDEMQDLAVAFNNMSDRLQSIYQDLERQVHERSKQLVRSERLAGVGFLAAGVAHEINNPLASISFCGEALERRLKGILDLQPNHPDVPLIQRYVLMIQQEAFRCKEITQKLLEFSRMGDRPRQMADLAELVQSVLEMVQHLPNHQDKRIVFEVQQRPHLLLSVPEIKSVILNLIVNALESMDTSGLLTIKLNVANDAAVLSFTDTGCGMSQEVLDNLFEPFFTRSRTGKGTGLGLSISHRIISQHGGEIEANSSGINHGSTFTVRIPLRQTEPIPQEDPVAAVLKRAA
ncbi:MAG TPA: ATP-binding protein [Gemmatales bacterium]|nr:ATP-binding protein [Gemmatales bacterium]